MSYYEVCNECIIHKIGEDNGPYANMSFFCWNCPAADLERTEGFSQECVNLRENYAFKEDL